MIDIPAVCKNCGNIFPSGMAVENVRNIRISDFRSQCPNCNAMGVVPDGIYNVVNDTIDYIANHNYSTEELVRFRNMFQSALEEDMSYEELNQEASKQNLSLSDILPQDGEQLRTDIKWFIGIIIAVLSLLVSYSNRNATTEVETIDSEDVIQYIYDNPEEFDFVD